MPDEVARLVVDSSVAVKWFLSEGEPDVTEALATLERHLAGDVVLAAPDLLLLEVSNALRSRGTPAKPRQDAVRALAMFNVEFECLMTLHDDAVALSIGHDISVYDAVFAALANRLAVPLVTADRKLARAGACDVRLLGAQQAP